MGTGKQYDEEFKKQTIKLVKEIGTKAAAYELCIPKWTLGMWVQKARIGEIDTGAGSRTPGESLTIAQHFQVKQRLLWNTQVHIMNRLPMHSTTRVYLYP